MNIFRKIHNSLLVASKGKFIWRATLYNFVVSLILGTLINIIGGEGSTYNPIMGYSLGFMFLMGVVIGPFLETWLFQWLLLIFPLKIWGATPHRILLFLLLSSLLFGFGHYYNNYYIVMMILGGAYLGYIALLSCFFRKEKINIFYSVFVVHALSNFVGLSLYMLKEII